MRQAIPALLVAVLLSVWSVAGDHSSGSRIGAGGGFPWTLADIGIADGECFPADHYSSSGAAVACSAGNSEMVFPVGRTITRIGATIPAFNWTGAAKCDVVPVIDGVAQPIVGTFGTVAFNTNGDGTQVWATHLSLLAGSKLQFRLDDPAETTDCTSPPCDCLGVGSAQLVTN